jgi:3-dehydrosphinganine reductase
MAHVLVTGGSSGIGLALAELFLGRGERVSIIARDPARLEAAKAGLLTGKSDAAIYTAAADVCDRASLDRSISACKAAFGEIDVLIASAGIVEPGLFVDQSPEAFDEQIAVNLTGVANVTRSVYADMVVRGVGRILIVSSGAGLIGIPGYAAYCASKFALRGFGAALRAEARSRGLTVSVCFPPDTVTPQYERELPLRPLEAQTMMGKVKPWPVKRVAAAIAKGIDKGQGEIQFGLALRALGHFGPAVSRYFEMRDMRRIAASRKLSRNI